MADVDPIAKAKKNQQQGFMYRGVDDVMNVLQPLFIKHKIFIVPEVLEQTRETRETAKGGTLIYSILKVKFTFFAEDGTSISAIMVGEGMDGGDKASNKAQAIAFKYACFQVFCIPTEEMADPDKETPEPLKKKPEPEDKKPEPPKQTADERIKLVEQLLKQSKKYTMFHVAAMIKSTYGKGKNIGDIADSEFTDILAAVKEAINGEHS